jgi:hypothetical protein
MNDLTDAALLEELVGIERELAAREGDAYRRPRRGDRARRRARNVSWER